MRYQRDRICYRQLIDHIDTNVGLSLKIMSDNNLYFNHEQLEFLRKSSDEKDISTWNLWRLEDPHHVRRLKGPDLHYIELNGVDLSSANLSGVDLSEAELNGANLSGADLRGADLSLAKLNNANLSGANLKGSILVNAHMSKSVLINADLSDTDISGVWFDDANTSRWTIKGIVCTHIYRNGKRFDYHKGEFEKYFTHIESVIEIFLDNPHSDLTHYAGKIIEKLINEKYGEATIVFKGQEAVSNESTQQKYINFAKPDKREKLNVEMANIQAKLNTEFKRRKTKIERKRIVDINEEIEIGKVLVVRPKEIQHALNERYMIMGPLLKRIVHTIQEVLR